MAGHPAVLLHLYEVEGAVESARQVGHVNVEGELPVEQLEHVVVGLGAVQQEGARPDVFGEGTLD